MNEFTLDELQTLLNVFEKAGVESLTADEMAMLNDIKLAHQNRQELESMDLDDCLGGACKL